MPKSVVNVTRVDKRVPRQRAGAVERVAVASLSLDSLSDLPRDAGRSPGQRTSHLTHVKRNDPRDTDAGGLRRQGSRDQPRKSFIMAIIGASISKSGTICPPAGVMSFALRMRDARIAPASFSLSV